jgi:hypothetical protein
MAQLQRIVTASAREVLLFLVWSRLSAARR